MSQTNWMNVLGWGQEEIEEIRFVGYSYLKEGLLDISLPIFNALVFLTPQDPYVYQTLGAIYLQKGNNLSALDYIEKSLKLDPHHLPSLLNRAKTLYALGYRKQAAAQAKALQSCTEPRIASQAEALLLAF